MEAPRTPSRSVSLNDEEVIVLTPKSTINPGLKKKTKTNHNDDYQEDYHDYYQDHYGAIEGDASDEDERNAPMAVDSTPSALPEYRPRGLQVVDLIGYLVNLKLLASCVALRLEYGTNFHSAFKSATFKGVRKKVTERIYAFLFALRKDPSDLPAGIASYVARFAFPKPQPRRKRRHGWSSATGARDRQKWYYRQKTALFKAALRMRETVQAETLIISVPQTLNINAFVSNGSSVPKWLEAYAAAVEEMQRVGKGKIKVSIDKVWDRFNSPIRKSQLSPMHSLITAMQEFLPEDSTTSASELKDSLLVEYTKEIIKSDGAVDPSGTRFAKHISRALKAYASERPRSSSSPSSSSESESESDSPASTDDEDADDEDSSH